MTLNIHDPQFDQSLTLRQAFYLLQEFLAQFNARSPQETDTLASWLALLQDGGTADPAQLHDFIESARIVMGRGA